MRRHTLLQVEKTIPIGLILGLVFQAILVIWWASSLNTRVNSIEEWSNKYEELTEKIFRLEERFTALHEEVHNKSDKSYVR